MEFFFVSGPLDGLDCCWHPSDDRVTFAEILCKNARTLVAPQSIWYVVSNSLTIFVGDPTMTVEDAENVSRYTMLGNLFLWHEATNAQHSKGA